MLLEITIRMAHEQGAEWHDIIDSLFELVSEPGQCNLTRLVQALFDNDLPYKEVIRLLRGHFSLVEIAQATISQTKESGDVHFISKNHFFSVARDVYPTIDVIKAIIAYCELITDDANEMINTVFNIDVPDLDDDMRPTT